MSPLSYSAYDDFITCPHMYKLKRIDKLRPTGTPAYLPFGSAMDEGLNMLLTGREDYFSFTETKLNELLNPGVSFSFFDYDGELLDQHMRIELLSDLLKVGYKGNDPDGLVKTLFGKIEAGEELSENQTKALALCCKTSLEAKAVLMFEAYKQQVLPLITKVHKVQQKLNWKDAKGNSFTGVIDLLCEMKGYDGLVLPDHKTAARAYDENEAQKSMQLALYSSQINPTWVGYVVFVKQIKKNRVKICGSCGNNGTGKRHKTCDAEIETKGSYVRCDGEWVETIQPEAVVQLIVQKIPKRNEEISLQALSDTCEAIKAGVFPRNLKACHSMYGKPCPYYNLCWKGEMDGLEKKS